jgi:hypothetical protein
VLIVVCGAVLLLALPGTAVFAAPVEIVARFPAFANAFAIPCIARLVLLLETCVASVAYPAIAYAAATVVTSSTKTNGSLAAYVNGLLAGHCPSAAISPMPVFVPDPLLPPSA